MVINKTIVSVNIGIQVSLISLNVLKQDIPATYCITGYEEQASLVSHVLVRETNNLNY